MQPSDSSSDSVVSNPEAGLSAFDEWRNDNIVFTTTTDASLARLAFSKDMDPSTMENFLALIQKPSFALGESTFRNLADIHSYAHNFRKTQIAAKNAAPKSVRPPRAIPFFVWNEVILRIGTQWVDFVSKVYDDAVGRDQGEDEDYTFQRKFMTNGDMLDLRTASVVRRSWTSPAQRQLGRVLLLDDLSDAKLTTALGSPLYGNWTKIVAIKGSERLILLSDENVPEYENIEDLLSSSLPLLRTLVTRLPCLTSLYFETSISGHSLMLLKELKIPHSLQAVTMFIDAFHLFDETKDLVAMLSQWPALRKITLVGFVWDADVMDQLTRLAMSVKSSLSDIIISGKRGRPLHHSIPIQRIHLLVEKRPGGNFSPSGVWMLGLREYDIVIMEEGPEDDGPVEIDFEVIRHDIRLPWLSNVNALHLRKFRQSEVVEQIFDITRAVSHLSWSESKDSQTFVPSFLLPSTLRSLQLSLNVAADHDWHKSDRELQSLLLSNSNANLKDLWLSIHFRGDCRNTFPETNEDILDIFFPRASKICIKKAISFIFL